MKPILFTLFFLTLFSGVKGQTAKLSNATSGMLTGTGTMIADTDSVKFYQRYYPQKWMRVDSISFLAMILTSAKIRIEPQKTGNYIIHFSKNKLFWLNDSTAIYKPNYKPKKAKLKIIGVYTKGSDPTLHNIYESKKPPEHKVKHFKQMPDGSFYLKELKPGETATFSMKIPVNPKSKPVIKHSKQKQI